MSIIVTLVGLVAIVVGLAYVYVQSMYHRREGGTVIDASRRPQPPRTKVQM